MKKENNGRDNIENSKKNYLLVENHPLDDEYKAYRDSLIFYKECPACHYLQGMIFLGISFFSLVRLQFLWNSLKWKSVGAYFFFSIFSGSVGFYKISYSYHIYISQGKVYKRN